MIDYANVFVKLRFDFKIRRFFKKEERHAILKYKMFLNIHCKSRGVVLTLKKA